MGGLEYLFVGRQRQLDACRLCRVTLGTDAHQPLGFALVLGEMAEQDVGIALFEVVGRLFDLVLVVDVAIGQTARLAVLFPLGPDQVVDVLDALQIHREALDAVGDLAGDRLAIDAADLLEVGELGHLHAVEPDLPAQAPGAQRRVFPVVLDEADVVLLQVQAQRLERAQVELEDVLRRGLEHDLVLVVVLQPVRVLAIAAVLRAARRLHIGGAPRLGADRAQEGMHVRGTGANLQIDGLQQRASLPVPVGLQGQDHLLEGQHNEDDGSRSVGPAAGHRSGSGRGRRPAGRSRRCQTQNSSGFCPAAADGEGQAAGRGPRVNPEGSQVPQGPAVIDFCIHY
ncbi:hypothetical protein CR3_2148 [Cupriavidus gilardii CR3]|nr:hypothetical protein CR3_2148 [Cupriavidus gilardii CR3]